MSGEEGTSLPIWSGSTSAPDRTASLDADAAAEPPVGLRGQLLDEVVALARDPLAVQRASPLETMPVADALAAWFGTDIARVGSSKQGLLGALDRDIAMIDGLLSEQVNAILHAPAFQRLEAGWRGLLYLANVTEGIARAKIRFLSLSWNDLVRDLERAPDFDQSQIFHKVYSDEFGMPGGEPFGLLIGDYEVQHRRTPDHPTDDVAALKFLSAVAAAAFAPIVLGVSPTGLKLDSFRDLGRPLDLGAVFRQAEYQRWNAMRTGDDMRFIGLALPRILMRQPYADSSTRADGFRFREKLHEPDGSGYLWGNAAYAFASVVLHAFANYGWFADIRGAPRDEARGGLVTDLSVLSFGTDRPGIAIKPSTECAISDAHEKELADLGFIALRKMPLTEYSVFYANQSVQLPPRFDGVGANVNARLSAMLQYVLCISRFAHFVKVLGRDRVGSVMTAEECQAFLQRWLMNYCEGSESAAPDIKARYPLREGRVEVRDIPGRPGSYSCVIFLRPHFQLDDVATGFRLVTELAPPRAA